MCLGEPPTPLSQCGGARQCEQTNGTRRVWYQRPEPHKQRGAAAKAFEFRSGFWVQRGRVDARVTVYPMRPPRVPHAQIQ